MKENIILCFSLYLLFPTVCSAASIDERFQNMEHVIQTLLAENKALKNRLDNLEELQHRVLLLEENCGFFDKSIRTGDTPSHIPDIHEEPVFSNEEQADTANNTEERSSPDRDSMARKMSPQHRIVTSSVASSSWHLSKRAVESEVAFHVYLSGNRVYSSHEIFKFDVETVDVGGGFNTADGIFDAPATGLYVFSWTVAAPQGSFFSAELIVNGAVQGVVESDSDLGGPGNGVHPATGVVLANVNAGNHVFVRFHQGTSGHVKSDSYMRTSFSGWLLL
ncbi:uncharacterized protein LOC123541560 [Mercenaria mercenaria]|uniref:uncharacterized protein LOC123541560 n=1 Tax=Mercenaria mercenaria TaxID=6596 RepID=UPI00234F7D6C|nr:uncharacterized protein LOC123541560 [Mercenaria mercenaria]